MNALRLSLARASTILALTTLPISASVAIAGEPRPWLCRDKPAFSDDHPMQYRVTASGGAWQIFFMQFEMNAAHDGFSIKESHPVTSAPLTGTLPSGSYYAVALHRQGSAWVCSYGDEQSRAPGEIKKLCYATESGPDCQVRLSVTSDTR